MSEKLEDLVAKGEKTVETYEERAARMKEQQERERAYKQANENMNQRKAFLKKMIELLDLEVRYKSLGNQFTEESIRKAKLEAEVHEMGLDNLPEDETDQNTSTEE